MAANAEKVKSQEVEIKELINKLDEDKEELHYLKNKLDQKYDVIDDMESELDRMERKLKERNEIESVRNVNFRTS